jgi:hypothetical protein
MNAMTKLFLRAKHWQIFLMLFGAFFVGQVAVICSIAVAARSAEDFGKFSQLLWVVTLPFMFGLLGWLWSMGKFLSSIIPSSLRLQIGFFRFALIYPAVYVFAFIAFFETRKPAMFALIFPFHLFAMFCMFYNLYFVSKSLVLAETGKPASFYDYAGPFFLIWFFPIGVWVVQPRINRIYAQKRSGEPITGVNAG